MKKKIHTRLPTYKVVFKDLTKLYKRISVVGICGPERHVPEKTIFIEKRLNKWERIRVIAHERTHALWFEDGLDFDHDDQIDIESLFHVPRALLTQTESSLVRFLSRNFKLKVSRVNDLLKIRQRINQIVFPKT